MSIFDKFFSRKKTVVGIEDLGRILTGGNGLWSSHNQLEQYGKSLYVYAAVNKIATKMAAIELKLFKIKSKTGDSEEILGSEILDLVTKINPFQTRSEFLKTAWINKKLTGEAFWVKIRNARGKVIELWNLRPDLVTVIADPTLYIKQYEFQKSNGQKEIFAPEDIIHFKDPNPMSTLRGMSPIAVSKYRIETEEQATRYQKDFFKNNARPDALLMTEQQLDGEQRAQMTSSWEERHRGKESGSKIGLLEGGMKYQQVSISQREMDYIESMKFTRDDILVAFGVPKSVITTDEVNYSNAETGIRLFLSETIQPEMTQLVEVLNEFLVSPDFGEEYYFDFKDPTPSDRAAMRADHTAGYGKWLTTNEIRTDYNLPAVEGGDVIAIPVAQVNPQDPQSSINTPAKYLQREDDARRAKTLRVLQGRPILRQKFELIEMVTKEVSASMMNDLLKKEAAKKKPYSVTKSHAAKDAQSPKLTSLLPDKSTKKTYYDITNKKLDARAKEFETMLLKEFAGQEDRVLAKLNEIESKSKGIYTKMRHDEIMSVLDKKKENKLFITVSLPYLEDFAKQGGLDAAELLDDVFNMTETLKKAMAKRAAFFSNSVNTTTFDKLVETLTAGTNAGEGIGELTKRVKEVYSEIPTSRAAMIARTETTNANNEGHLEEYRQSDIVKGKEWIATMDDRTRDEHAAIDGEIVDLEASFSNGLQYPQEINCRCVLAPARFD